MSSKDYASLFFFISMIFFLCSYLYQIAHLGDEDDEPEFSSAMPLEEGDTFFFAPRALKNLVVVDELPSYAPIIGMTNINIPIWFPISHINFSFFQDHM